MKAATSFSQTRGFTLVEVLVALSIVAITLLAGSNAFIGFSNNLQRQNDAILAQLCAENGLITLRLRRELPAIGTSSSECLQAGRSFNVQTNVQSTLNPSFRKVTLLVNNEQLQPILQITTAFSRF